MPRRPGPVGLRLW